MENKIKNGNEKVNILDNYMSLQDSVYVVLREWILSGKLSPNDPLNTNQLSKQLNVSRTPVRDAVNKLVSLGLAVKTAHKEAKVADLVSDEMHEIFRMRSALEGIAAFSATRFMSDVEKEKLFGLANRAEECSLMGDERGFMEYDQRFHFMIYESLKTPMLIDMAKQLYILSKHNSVTGYHIEGRSSQVLKEHEDIVESILRGDADQAERAGCAHLNNSITNMRNKFETLKNTIKNETVGK